MLLIPNSTTFAQVNKIKGKKIVEPKRTTGLLTPPAVYKDKDQICVKNIKKGIKWKRGSPVMFEKQRFNKE